MVDQILFIYSTTNTKLGLQKRGIFFFKIPRKLVDLIYSNPQVSYEILIPSEQRGTFIVLAVFKSYTIFHALKDTAVSPKVLI